MEVPDSFVCISSELNRIQDDLYGVKGRLSELYEHVASLHKRQAEILERQGEMLVEIDRLSSVLDKAEEMAKKNSITFNSDGSIGITPKE